ncbi:MAG: diguanylate cyclase, partial [Gallionellaceae bacterium]|nr:diguanylate cyclase [Gallionellaceae bacterium]
VSFEELHIPIAASIGIAAMPEHADSADGLIRCADQALYSAKSRGRDQAVAFGDTEPGSG